MLYCLSQRIIKVQKRILPARIEFLRSTTFISYSKMDLESAIDANDLEAVKTIIGAGRFHIDAIINPDDGANALDMACRCQGKPSFKIAQYLLEAGASTQILTYGLCDHPTTVLHTAYQSGNLEIIALLLAQSPPPPLDIGKCEGETALHISAARGSDSAIRLLLDAGAKIKMDKFDRTPLHCAAFSGSVITVQLLLDYSVEMHSTSLSPLFCAAAGGHYNLTRLFLREGCLRDLNERDSNGLNVVMMCLAGEYNRQGSEPRERDDSTVWDEEREKVVWLLIESGADVLVADMNNMTMLHYAAELGAYSMVQYLIDKGVDVNAKSKSVAPEEDGYYHVDQCTNWTALHYASRNSDTRMVQILLDNGAQVDELDDLHRNALHLTFLAYQFGPGLEMGPSIYDTARLLVLRGIAINIRDHYSHQTPLHYAAISDLRPTATMKLLLDHGADINALDKGGESPLGYSCRLGYLSNTKFLRLYGAEIAGMDEEQELNLRNLEEGINLERWH